MLSPLLVVLAIASRAECSCREISTEDDDENRCVIKEVNVTLEIGQEEEILHPECQAYKCVREDLVIMCGLGYNDEEQYGPDTSGPSCTDTKNPDCSVTMECIGKSPVIIADKKPSYEIPSVG